MPSIIVFLTYYLSTGYPLLKNRCFRPLIKWCFLHQISKKVDEKRGNISLKHEGSLHLSPQDTSTEAAEGAPSVPHLTKIGRSIKDSRTTGLAFLALIRTSYRTLSCPSYPLPFSHIENIVHRCRILPLLTQLFINLPPVIGGMID